MHTQLNINDDHLREVLRIRLNTVNALHLPVKQPIEVKTVEPKEKLPMNEWFEHIRKSLREKDKFGNLIIK